MLLYLSLILFVVALKQRRQLPFAELVPEAALYFSAFMVVFTETISLFGAINFWTVLAGWLLFCAGCAWYLYRCGFGLSTVRAYFSVIKKLPLASKATGSVFGVMVLLLLYQGLVYPPNNWDSMSYHMTRIAYWVGNGSVDHFPTHMLRNLYQPPLGEYYIMHCSLLNGNDYLANSIQLLFLVFCCSVLWSLLKYAGAGSPYRWLALFLAISIPSAELQASTTKNDIICGFFILAALYYCLLTYRNANLRNFVLLGLSVGLGMFTKGTAYIYLAPVLALFAAALIIKAVRARSFGFVRYAAISALLAIALNACAYYRNYQIDHNIINIDKAEARAYSNEKMDARLLASSLLKNGGLHLGYPLAGRGEAMIRLWHRSNAINIDDPATNYYGEPYKAPVEIKTNEDLVPNTLHFILLLLAFPALLLFGYKKKHHRLLLMLSAIMVLQGLLFAAYLKWQPWHTRLHIPFFILGALLTAFTAQQVKVYRYLLICCLPLMLYSFYFYFAYNNLRPMVPNLFYTARTAPDAPRFSKYFAARPSLYQDYAAVERVLDQEAIATVGSMVSNWEYPLFYNCFSDSKHIFAINVFNNTTRAASKVPNPDAIISNLVNMKIITFAGREYYNQTPGNKSIWIYK